MKLQHPLAAALLIGSLALTGCGTKERGPDTVDWGAIASEKANPDFSYTAPVEEAPSISLDKGNALSSAQSYLDTQGYSRSALIEQLVFEDYAPADARWAVNNVGADWNAQAAQSAQEYLNSQPFSRVGLIEQLEFDGFTPAQARYGVSQTGF
jgi:hypothetical protein